MAPGKFVYPVIFYRFSDSCSSVDPSLKIPYYRVTCYSFSECSRKVIRKLPDTYLRNSLWPQLRLLTLSLRRSNKTSMKMWKNSKMVSSLVWWEIYGKLHMKHFQSKAPKIWLIRQRKPVNPRRVVRDVPKFDKYKNGALAGKLSLVESLINKDCAPVDDRKLSCPSCLDGLSCSGASGCRK